MSQIIDRTGFVADAWETAVPVSLEDYAGGAALIMSADGNPADIVPYMSALKIIVIPFAGFADGRGFSLAAQLRALGYAGHLRAEGHLLVDQFRAALRAGFDDLAISDAQAARNPEPQWLAVTHTPGYHSRIFTA